MISTLITNETGSKLGEHNAFYSNIYYMVFLILKSFCDSFWLHW